MEKGEGRWEEARKGSEEGIEDRYIEGVRGERERKRYYHTGLGVGSRP